jgi:hypothetical protein
MNQFNVVKRRASAVGLLAVSAAQKAANLARSPAAIAGTGLGFAGASRATDFTIDTTSIVAVITGGVTTISAIGIAVLSLVVVIKLFKWVQRVL